MSYSRTSQPANTKESKVLDIWSQIQSDHSSPSTSASTSTSTPSTSADASTSNSNSETYTLFLGEKSSGKTTLIQSFLGKEISNDTIKPTIALDYQFARRATPNNTLGLKDVSHIFELGGGVNVGDYELVGVPLGNRIDLSVVVVCLDMSVKEDIVGSLIKWIQVVQRKVAEGVEVLRKNFPDRYKDLMEKSEKRVNENHPDFCIIKPSLIPIIVIGNKYDIFKDIDLQSRKIIMQSIRFIVHSLGGVFVSGSYKDKNVRDMYRSVAREMFFPVTLSSAIDKQSTSQPWLKSSSINSDNPLSLKPGYDTFDEILRDLPKGSVKPDFITGSGASDEAFRSLNGFCETVCGKSNVFVLGLKAKDDREGDRYDDNDDDEEDGEGENGVINFPETVVDEARNKADLKLVAYKKGIERREDIARSSLKVDSVESSGGGEEEGRERRSRKSRESRK